MTYEVEQKFHLDPECDLEDRLEAISAVAGAVERHSDTYYNHPCRDFAETREALRIRRVDGVPRITYKGPKLPGGVKARRELEWRLDPGDQDGRKTAELWTMLGFRKVATVTKRRRHYSFQGQYGAFTVMIDDVDSLGRFAEIELVVEDLSQIEPARARVLQLATRLGLDRAEPRSYLRMILELDTPG